tara:strand:- start:167 stop:523 length:357 start_codon:yes stop_codon:yes gene_type:complete
MAGVTRSRTTAASIIKSIQRGQTTVSSSSTGQDSSSSVTINAVDLDKSFVSVSTRNGYGTGNIYNNNTTYGYSTNTTTIGGYLASSTSISLQQGRWRRYNATIAHVGGTAYWEVIEYE